MDAFSEMTDALEVDVRKLTPQAPAPQKVEPGQAGRIMSIDMIRKFLNGGNATFTMRNVKSGNRLTFKVTKPRNPETGQINHSASTRFVGVLSGSDNESNYTYVGAIFENLEGARFSLTKKSRVTRDAVSYRAFEALWKFVEVEKRMPNGLEIWHEGHCARCNRKLTVPESIESGFGPECAKHV